MRKNNPNLPNIDWALIAILTIAASLRFFELGSPSLWLDELATYETTSPDILSFIQSLKLWAKGSVSIHNPPGYFIFIHIWQRLFGSSEFALRAPSALFGIASVYLLYRLSQNSSHKNLIYLSPLLFAVHPKAISIAHQARPYSGLIFFCILASIYWLKLAEALRLRQFSIRNNLFCFILAALAASQFHFFGLLLIGIQFAVLTIIAWQNNIHLKKIIYSGLLITCTYLPIFYLLIDHGSRTPSWVGQYSYFDRLIRFLLSLTIGNLSHSRQGTMTWPSIFLLLTTTTLLLSFIVSYSRRIRLRDAKKHSLLLVDTLFLIWLFAPALIVSLSVELARPIFLARYLVISLPAFCLLTARAVENLAWGKYKLHLIGLGLAALYLITIITEVDLRNISSSHGYRGVVSFVAEHSNHQTPLLFGCVYQNKEFNYYLRRFNLKTKKTISICDTADLKKLYPRLETTTAKHFWFLSGHRDYSPELLQTLKKEFFLITNVSLRKYTAWKFSSIRKDFILDTSLEKKH